ncbi:hypothetical protein ACFVHB_10835 [Kitasatospora sp. NPDC127111]|uniref:hypothetical protein n=1 Tax=Kitasatospora sp. NPDC127111 TaxID=3345363 RepID=UPI00362DCEDE
MPVKRSGRGRRLAPAFAVLAAAALAACTSTPTPQPTTAGGAETACSVLGRIPDPFPAAPTGQATSPAYDINLHRLDAARMTARDGARTDPAGGPLADALEAAYRSLVEDADVPEGQKHLTEARRSC